MSSRERLSTASSYLSKPYFSPLAVVSGTGDAVERVLACNKHVGTVRGFRTVPGPNIVYISMNIRRGR